jgi:hypothetical protein
MAAEEDVMSNEAEADQFAVDYRDGEARAREWIAGRGGLPDLLHVVRDMPRGGEMSGLEAGFLSTIDAAVRGDRQGAANAPDVAKAQQLLDATPPQPPIDVDAFRRRMREHERRARFEELARNNASLSIGSMPREGWGRF